MASSINASTTAGVVTTADTSGVLNIQTAGTTAIAIDASQAVSFTNAPTVTGGTANGVAYLNGSKVLTTGSALVFDGTNLSLGTVGAKVNFATTGSATVNYVGGSADGYSLEMVMQRGASQPLKYKQDYGVGHVWSIAGSDKMTLDASGNLLVGTTSFSYTPSQGTTIATGSVGSIGINHANGTTSGNGYMNFVYNTTAIGSISQNGTTAVAYNTTSDYRLKKNVQPLAGALSRIVALKPCTYTWKSAPDEVGEGFIAHELAEVCPQAVTGEKDAVNEDGSIKPQSIDTSFLVATLTAAIQEQQALITQLQADVAALKGA